MASSITIRGLSKSYGAFAALSDVSIDIPAGQFITLLGPSGSGKTTLLMSIAGFSHPDRGSIRIDDQEILDLEPNKRDIGVVFQNYALFPHMSVEENIAYPLKLRKIAGAQRDARVKRALQAVQMDGYGARRIHELSGGQRQRIAVARAIVFEPRIILMDEPLSALDKKLREEMQIELKHLHQSLGRTIVYVTHDQKEALTLADQVVVMDRGRIVQKDSPRDIYEQPKTRFVADFIGNSNFLPLHGAGTGTIDAQVSDAFRRQHMQGRQRPLLVIRPEKLEIVPAGFREPGSFYVDATVGEILFQGDLVIVFARLPNGQMVRLQRGTRRTTLATIPPEGSPIRLALHEEDAIVVEDDRP
ncbi:MAG TPA: ABC transporter ATP-binding protein [Geminicoccus sp.]|jgi:putative spermidine/putrescine transport system ATP-binding protein|uniref:ABC transporter ATP-binding protein n=1 Tax=Geminicoccus sp. TaxID=2024832 RepID=UPI002E35D463|nr:ABC transporter ATP-binding protein [Geminicoccus sp.]HEX2526278.1 ABC transporter ATP-binding protein [Geminicoccus sp.]